MTRARLIICAAAVVALAMYSAPTGAPATAHLATPPSTATILVGFSMGKVRLGMKKTAVVAAFGKPSWCFHAYSKDDEECDWLAPPDTRIKGIPEPQHSIGAVGVDFWKGRVIWVTLIAPQRERPEYKNVPLLSGWRTSKGIGLGSSLSALLAAYPDAKRLPHWVSISRRQGGKTSETRFLFLSFSGIVHQIVILQITPQPGA